MTISDVEQIDEDDHYDLIEGALHRMPPTSEGHMFYGANLFVELGAYVRARKLGRVALPEGGFILSRDPDTLLSPDGAFIQTDRLPEAIRLSGFSEIIPDLVIEITSPSDRRSTVERKIALWLGAGVRAVWQVDPAGRTVTVHRPGHGPTEIPESGELDGGEVVPGFRLKVAEIFE